MSEVISSFRSLRTGSQVFAFLMLFLCVLLHTMSSGKRLQLLCIFPFAMHLLLLCIFPYVVLVCHQYDVCENYVGSVYIGLSESDLCVFCELCPVSFLVVDECPSIFL